MKFPKNVFLLLIVVTFFESCNNDEVMSFSESQEVYFENVDDKFFSTRANDNNVIETVGKYSHEWETFYVEKIDLNNYIIKSYKGLYLTYDNPDQNVFATEKDKKKAGLFKFSRYKEYYQLRTSEEVIFRVGEDQRIQTKTGGRSLLFNIKTKKDFRNPLTSFNGFVFGRFFVQLLIFVIILFLYFKFIQKKIPNKFSLKTILVIAFVGLFIIFNIKKWKYEKVITNDTIMYYQYLPATFIFNDLSFSFLENPPADYNGTMWVYSNSKTGRKTSKFTIGFSYMLLPFFIIGHVGALLFNYTAYGYSDPYSIMISLSSWFYAFLGLLYLRKILLKYYNDVVVGFTLISIGLATNLFYYITMDGAMTHPASFCLFAMFIWFTVKWYEKKRLKDVIKIGLIMGLISLIRPTNAIVALVFVLYDVKSLKELKERFLLFWEYKTQLMMIVLFSIVLWLPQVAFWKYATGDFFFFSYGEEGFFFSNPQIFKGLFSYRKGWLVYTPIMIFALIGVFLTLKDNKKWSAPLVIFIPLNIYVMYSWWCWWYGGGFGSRPMIESYALLAIPLASFYSYFDKMKTYLRSIPLFIIFLAITLNLLQTYQTKTWLHYDSMTKEAYWSNFATLGWSKNYMNQIKRPDYKGALKGIEGASDE